MYATTSLFNRRGLIAAFLLLFVMSAAYGFAANNTVNGGYAGDGIGAISGYTITNVKYTLKPDPRYLNEVSFTLNAAAETVKIAFQSNLDISTDPGLTNWYDCDATTVDVTCTIPAASSVSVNGITNLRVVAVQ
jgi:hypothetical protein